jgi:dimeric dUTPase (all-alpha-NTP-PPase superfamily)
MDKLDEMFEMQKTLQIRLGNQPMLFDQRNFELMYIGCITELCEMIENTAWKPWKKSAVTNEENLKQEIIDLWHFVINITMCSGVNPELLFKMFCEKNEINNRRQNNGY